MKLISNEERLAMAVRSSPALFPRHKAKNPAGRAAIAREKAREAAYRVYILLECTHLTTRDTQERWEDGKHPGQWYCEICDCWKVENKLAMERVPSEFGYTVRRTNEIL